MNIEIRPEAEGDYEAIFELNKIAFGQENEAKLVDLLRQSDAFIPELSLVAEHIESLVGHILFSRIRIADDAGNAYESLALAPLAVRPDVQKQGIGRQLITHGLKEAQILGFKSVIVLGHEAYYPRFGFVPAKKWAIKAPFEVPDNAFMAIQLVENGLKNVSGIVQYAKAFEMV